ncbi:MAG: phosphate signaling complex protein PhoU [Oscillospiraceae bacterium]|nr:phosphate signaling complex protein PhoU [Oscillospiraceae bacterium]
MRNRFDEQLFEMNRELIEMGAMCEEAIASAVKALTNNDIELAQKVKRNSSAIDRMEREIEGHCMKLLLHQQPVARDLRAISAALKMITDMERIGDQAEDIAEIVISIGNHTMDGLEIIELMARETVKMVTDSVDAFVKKDVELAQEVIRRDDIVDSYFLKVKYDIIKLISENSADGEFALDLLMISKYFERIGDHATNIAEWVIYSVTGTHKEA